MRFKKIIVLFIILSIPVILFDIACEHDVSTDSSENTAPVFSTIQNKIFVPSCAGCHLDGASAGGLDLSRYDNIVNVSSGQMPGTDQIEPGEPAQSYIYLKMTDDESISGDVMPPSGTLPRQQIDLLRTWIESGAPRSN